MQTTLMEALTQHGRDLQPVLKIGHELQRALKAWQQAQLDGNCADIEKFSSLVVELSTKLGEPASLAAQSWTFDSKAYLASGMWLDELVTAASKEGSGVRALPGDNELICSPVVVRPESGKQALKIGKKPWKKLRPDLVIAELKKINATSSGQNNQAFLDALFVATEYLNRESKGAPGLSAKLRDIYDLYCLVPGYKKENPDVSFAQALYSLHRSEVQTTRAGRKYDFGFPQGQPKSRDLFDVISADGKPISYYLIHFR